MKSMQAGAALVLLLGATHAAGGDTLPQLREGRPPATLDELWAGFDPRAEPLRVEVLKEWEQDGAVCRVVRYEVGTFKGAPARVAAFYVFPKGGTNLPAILQLHGGGQSANFDGALADAKRGYAHLSLNWGGNPLNFGRAAEKYDGPQTDWGALDATHPPQRDKANHFAGALTPDEFTLDPVESPRNSNWFIVLIAARRGLTFLEQQPEVDGARLGVTGHSMGGKLTTNLAGIDSRVKAAVPSCGGAGDLTTDQADVPGGLKKPHAAVELACISDNAYIPRIACPVLWLSPANDFHAHIDHMAWNWRNVPDERLRFSIAPHLNHRHPPEFAITEKLWFAQHLRGALTLPATPALTLTLATSNGVPMATVRPDFALPVIRVELYYAIDPHELTRFWRDAQPVSDCNEWKAELPVLSVNQPLFVFANVVYDLPVAARGERDPVQFALSSRVLSASPEQLRAAGVKATDRPERLIDDGTRGWTDWYQLNWGHPPLWFAATRKLKDPKWRGPDGAALRFEIKCETDNTLVAAFDCNQWGAFQPGQPAVTYTAVRELKGSPDWQTVTVNLADLRATDPKFTEPPPNWQTVAEFSISPSGEVVKDGVKTKVGGRAWQGPRAIRHLCWEGGAYASNAAPAAALSAAEHDKAFNNAIRVSLEQERRDQEAK